MQEVSRGNKEYEKEVTRQFIDEIPTEIKALEDNFNEHRQVQMKQVAHNMKTTISVMGLNAKLDTILETIENNPTNEPEIKNSIEKVKFICDKALHEAKSFLASLS